jgi:hypothetical protein
MMSNRSAVPFSISRTPFAPAAQFRPTVPRGREKVVPAPHARARPEARELPVDELNFCHLKTPQEIARISHLREQIQLPSGVTADPSFGAREKKEIRRASSAPSNAGEAWSGRSGSFR